MRRALWTSRGTYRGLGEAGEGWGAVVPEAVLLQLVGNPRLGDAPRVEDALGREVHVADRGATLGKATGRADAEDEVVWPEGGESGVGGDGGGGCADVVGGEALIAAVPHHSQREAARRALPGHHRRARQEAGLGQLLQREVLDDGGRLLLHRHHEQHAAHLCARRHPRGVCAAPQR